MEAEAAAARTWCVGASVSLKIYHIFTLHKIEFNVH